MRSVELEIENNLPPPLLSLFFTEGVGGASRACERALEAPSPHDLCLYSHLLALYQRFTPLEYHQTDSLNHGVWGPAPLPSVINLSTSHKRFALVRGVHPRIPQAGSDPSSF